MEKQLSKIAPKVICAFVAAALAAGMALLPATSSKAYAASSKPYMKTLKYGKWDLNKKSGVVYNQDIFALNTTYKQKVTIKNLKITKKGNKKTATFNMVFQYAGKAMTKSQVNNLHAKANKHSWWKNYGIIKGSIEGSMYTAMFVDYNTGTHLPQVGTTINGNPKVKNVKITYKVTKTSKPKTYKGSGNKKIVFRTLTVPVTITMPANYDGLCLGVMKAATKPKSADLEFTQEFTKPFGKTSWYSANGNNAHWMRIK